MLRVKVYINEEELEDIQIVNTGVRSDTGETTYKTKFGDIDFYVYHNRQDGWEVLLQKVLQMKMAVNDELLKLNLRDIIKI